MPSKSKQPSLSSQNTEQLKRSSLMRGKLWRSVLLMFLLVAVLLAALYFFAKDKGSQKTVFTPVCSQELLSLAEPNLATSEALNLAPIVQEIESLSNYDKDPNCLYVLTIFYINTSDPVTARANLDKLKAVYSHDKMNQAIYSYPPEMPVIEDLEENVVFLEKITEKNAGQNVVNVEDN